MKRNRKRKRKRRGCMMSRRRRRITFRTRKYVIGKTNKQTYKSVHQ